MSIEVTTALRQAVRRDDIAEPSAPQAIAAEAPYPTLKTQAERFVALETEPANMQDRWLRAEAEVATMRVRNRRDLDEAKQFATQKFAADVVEMAESLQRGVASMPTPIARGLHRYRAQLHRPLEAEWYHSRPTLSPKRIPGVKRSAERTARRRASHRHVTAGPRAARLTKRKG